MAHPLPPTARQVSLSDAIGAFGGPIVLPNSVEATPSDAGAVWLNQLPGTGLKDASATVAVTFPKQGLTIRYTRPPIDDIAGYVQDNLKTSPGTEAISLNGSPALATPWDPNGPGWGGITFVAGGTTISVFGQQSESYLQAVAQSILDRMTASSG